MNNLVSMSPLRRPCVMKRRANGVFGFRSAALLQALFYLPITAARAASISPLQRSPLTKRTKSGILKTIIHIIRPLVLTLLILTGSPLSVLAEEVSIPDPGLNAAIRQALQKPAGPLTEQDLLSLTNLNARDRN